MWPSPNRSGTRSWPLPAGSRPPTPTASRATQRKSARSRDWYPTATPTAPGSSCAANAPTPAAQLSLFDTIEGFRHQVTATDTLPGHGGIQYPEARHRAHARVEDRIRTGKDTGFGRFPSWIFAINAAWLELALTGIDLIAWTQHLLLDGDLAKAEPKKLRYRLLHVRCTYRRGSPARPASGYHHVLTPMDRRIKTNKLSGGLDQHLMQDRD